MDRVILKRKVKNIVSILDGIAEQDVSGNEALNELMMHVEELDTYVSGDKKSKSKWSDISVASNESADEEGC